MHLIMLFKFILIFVLIKSVFEINPVIQQEIRIPGYITHEENMNNDSYKIINRKKLKLKLRRTSCNNEILIRNILIIILLILSGDIELNPEPESLFHHINTIKGLKIAHLNVQSILNKVDLLKLMMSETTLDVLCISETWLNHGIYDCEVRINGYIHYRNDRKERLGDGVMIHIRETIPIKKVCYMNGIECISIILDLKEKLIISCVYRPQYNNNSFNTDYEILMNKYENSEHIILGD